MARLLRGKRGADEDGNGGDAEGEIRKSIHSFDRVPKRGGIPEYVRSAVNKEGSLLPAALVDSRRLCSGDGDGYRRS